MRVTSLVGKKRAKQRRALKYIHAATLSFMRMAGSGQPLDPVGVEEELALLHAVAACALGQGDIRGTGDLRDVFLNYDEVIRDDRGEVQCPCGSVAGLNLLGELPPLRPCKKCDEET